MSVVQIHALLYPKNVKSRAVQKRTFFYKTSIKILTTGYTVVKFLKNLSNFYDKIDSVAMYM